MNKCSKCGAEFEGNFCPECGTPSQAPKVCPKCGAQLKENVKFCPNCGCAFLPTQADETQTASSAPSAKAHTPIDWRNNKTLRKILLFAPLVIFALWSVLMFAFMAAPVMKGEPPVMPNVSVYGFFNPETVESDPDLAAITPAAGALVAMAAVALLYAGYLVYLQFKGGRVARWLAHYFSVLPYVLVLVCTSVIAVKFNAYAEGMDEMKGSFVSVTVSLTVVFLLLHAASLVLCKLFKISVITQEDREQAKQRFEAWLERRRYLRQCRPVIAQRLKKEPYIRGRSCGIICIVAIICLFVAICGSLPYTVQAIKFHSDYDTRFEWNWNGYHAGELLTTGYSYIYTLQFEYLEETWNEMPSQIEECYRVAQKYYGNYQEDTQAQSKGVDFEEWLQSKSYSTQKLNFGESMGYWSKAYQDWWANKRYVSTSELYELGVDGYIAQRYPDGFGDFVEEVTGIKSDTEEDYLQYYKTIEYEARRQGWSPYTGPVFIDSLQLLIPTIVSTILGIVSCVLAFRRKSRVSAVLGWLFVVVCCSTFIGMIFPTYENPVNRGDFVTFQIALYGMLPLAILFSLVNVSIQADDKRKTRKRFKREYDAQMAAQGDESALWFVAHKKDRKSKRPKSTADVSDN